MKKLSKVMIADLGIEALFAGKLWCYVPVVTEHGIGLGVAEANVAGYTPIPLTWANAEVWSEMDAHADELNAAMGVTEEAAMRIVASSMAQGKPAVVV